MHTIGKATTAALAAVFAIGMTTFFSLAESDFEGVWKVKDTAGQPFEITLSSGGAAKASRGEGMVGTWKEEGNTAVITWNTGWTTKIAKEGDQYKKSAYGKGQPLDGPPTKQYGRAKGAKGKVTALRLPHSIQGTALSVNSKAHSDRGRTLLKTHRSFRALAMDKWRAARAAA